MNMCFFSKGGGEKIKNKKMGKQKIQYTTVDGRNPAPPGMYRTL